MTMNYLIIKGRERFIFQKSFKKQMAVICFPWEDKGD